MLYNKRLISNKVMKKMIKKYLIYNYTTNEDIEQSLKAYDNAIDQKKELDYLHLLLNIVASFNVILSSVVYGC